MIIEAKIPNKGRQPSVASRQPINSFVFLKEGRILHKVFVDDIAYIEGLKDYVVVHHGGQKVMTNMNIRTIQSRLPGKNFVRISKSFLINLHHINTMSAHSVFIHDMELPIGDSYRKDLFENHIKGYLLER